MGTPSGLEGLDTLVPTPQGSQSEGQYVCSVQYGVGQKILAYSRLLCTGVRGPGILFKRHNSNCTVKVRVNILPGLHHQRSVNPQFGVCVTICK